MHVVPHPFGEEGADRAVDHASAEDRRLGGASLALYESARNFTGGIVTFFVIYEQREKVESLARLLGKHGRHEQRRVSMFREQRGVCLLREASHFKGHLFPI
ncbi:hypothetical protein SDC9_92544 [bioreactor metagenome]|uniref:Uncharacterized protein n=1 Tax=bioreactor metagenome TaxID=1076179 RepID=A0A644ZYF5_9ZZZZ